MWNFNCIDVKKNFQRRCVVRFRIETMYYFTNMNIRVKSGTPAYENNIYIFVKIQYQKFSTNPRSD